MPSLSPGHGLLVRSSCRRKFLRFSGLRPRSRIPVQVDAVAHKDQHDLLRQAQILDPLAHDVRIGRAEAPRSGIICLQPGVEILIAVDLLVQCVSLSFIMEDTGWM